jgi:hypothetical protein
MEGAADENDRDSWEGKARIVLVVVEGERPTVEGAA